ncbi:dihydrolipoamide acetyltransferase family protein [Arsenicicoccus sp. oral taxon 190]|uniref:dihydrolipoamide acetyltransferase family protein n=1 Tax=Arsenicicoccus sp. oral taxon 190 TaxID=1658671 RepID=UPI00067A1B0D|nr:dihydrolipoamide acetyltransferase family protein [Arsenicicoccus sp. oral taxon 190]AKT50567.1 branched-chain alpha-keto acid dehydrogenase subunit E2 [Arsenicicoccus sp. oral taxon 190]
MAIKKFNLPDPGEGLLEAEIVTWKVKEGDAVKVNDIVVEIETAKSLVELPIPWAGTVAQILTPEGATVDVGTPIIAIDDGTGGGDAPAQPDDASAAAAQAQLNEASAAGGDDASGAGATEERVSVLVGYGPKVTDAKRRPRKHQRGPLPTPSETKNPETWGGLATVAAVTEMTHPTVVDPHGVDVDVSDGAGTRPGKALAKPPVRKYAKDQGVDLAAVTGTGDGGIVTRADVDAFLAGGGQGAGAPEPQQGRAAGAAAYGTGGEREVRIPIKGVRKMTAQAMVGSAFTAPHVTEFITIDVTEMMALVERLKRDKEFKDVRVSPLLVVAKALVVAIRRNPGVNATWDEAAQEIVQKNYVNLGIAAATPRGLIVPNIKDADRMTMLELAQAMGGLVETARAGRTQPADMSGGTITITNVGVFGVDTGTPIINPGESAILAFGAVRRQPWVVTGADGSEEIVPRWVTQLALSFDHRLIDGELGSRFLADVAAVLADPARGLVWG